MTKAEFCRLPLDDIDIKNRQKKNDFKGQKWKIEKSLER